MSGDPGEVQEIAPPGWVNEDFPSKGSLLETLGDIASKAGDWSAKGADFFDVAGAAGPWDPIGAGATAVNQFTESTVQNPLLRAFEAGLAGAIDWAMGMTPLGPVLPALDSAASMAFGTSPGDLINAGLTGGLTAAESAISGNQQGIETFKAKAITGEYGSVIQKLHGG